MTSPEARGLEPHTVKMSRYAQSIVCKPLHSIVAVTSRRNFPRECSTPWGARRRRGFSPELPRAKGSRPNLGSVQKFHFSDFAHCRKSSFAQFATAASREKQNKYSETCLNSDKFRNLKKFQNRLEAAERREKKKKYRKERPKILPFFPHLFTQISQYREHSTFFLQTVLDHFSDFFAFPGSVGPITPFLARSGVSH